MTDERNRALPTDEPSIHCCDCGKLTPVKLSIAKSFGWGVYPGYPGWGPAVPDVLCESCAKKG